VIGTGGKNVKRIREEAHVFISVAKVPDPKSVKERIVNVKGKPTGMLLLTIPHTNQRPMENV
jgi:hypothetical protein